MWTNKGREGRGQEGRNALPRVAGRFRRTALAAVLVLIALPMSFRSGAGAEKVSLGTASAYAQAARVVPTAGELSLGIGFGESLTNYQNKVAIAEARGIDLGIIGSLLAAEGCDGGDPTFPAEQQPQAVHVESRDQKAASSQDSDPYGGGAITKFAQATQQPLSNAWSEVAPIPIPGLFEIRGARSESTTRYLDDGVREAHAVADIASVDILGGAVTLKELHWEVIHRTGNKTTRFTDFHIGGLVIAGTPLPTSDGAEGFAALKQALAPMGILVQEPRIREGAGFLFVDPLKFGVVPNATRDQVVGGLLGAGQPIREPLTQAIIDADCTNATYITVVDVVLGSVSGAGSLTLELGGVRATTRDLRFEGIQGIPVLPVEVPPVGEVVTGPRTTTTGPQALGPGTTDTAPLPAAVQPARAGGDPSDRGRLALVAGIGLAVILLAAEADRRKMRRAQKIVELEG